jgi:hypothetical protein
MTPTTTTTKPLTAALLNVAMGFSSDNCSILYAQRAHSDNINRLARSYYRPSSRFFFTLAYRRIILSYRIPAFAVGRNPVLI